MHPLHGQSPSGNAATKSRRGEGERRVRSARGAATGSDVAETRHTALESPLRSVVMISRPIHLLTRPPGGVAPKPLPEVLLERRATSHFKPDPVPEELLQAMLELAAQAPSGYNLQPWRFIVVRDPENRQRLQKAAMNQDKIQEAPVVVIAIGMKQESQAVIEEVLREGASRGIGRADDVDATAAAAREFLATIPMEVWVNRHTMIAVTTMMLVAEAYGFDTAPMEGFDPAAVKREFNIPAEAEVVALLAIGRSREPDKAYPGRFPLSRIVFRERYGTQWNNGQHA